MHIIDAIRGNNTEVVEDCIEAYRDYTGAMRLCEH